MTAELPVLDVPAAAPEPALLELAPESLTEVATIVPFFFFNPWIWTESPGRTAFRLTLKLLVSFVAPDSFTLTVLPEASLM